MSELVAYDAFRARYAEMSEAEFLAEVSDPHLVVLSGALAPHDPEAETFKGSRTKLVLGIESSTCLVPVRKRVGLLAFMITLGRANENDIVIADGRVSKFHGHFQQRGQEWVFVDSGSTNGTHRNGDPVARTPSELASGDRLSFGGCQALFLLPDQLYRYLGLSKQAIA